ncbi:uncharacterized protein LOC130898261 isoform X1 [Diorhabda carinulata]|uniref:uncharacterized protein LOC130898261 isoform X1 n=2 Tax=Diorhabda carinulata TaxID=1163345 RepID=UPI0025A0D190|nr:uncharacterized protein LOC130898261 isoform X1 [Diorhabda carinulata]
MNKSYEYGETLFDNFNYSTLSETLGDKQMYIPFMVYPKKSKSGSIALKNKFGAHPRNCSESDTYVSASPRQNRSKIDLELENLERNKERIKNARKKLHEKLSNMYPSEDQLFDVYIGDSCDVASVNSFGNIFERNGAYHRNMSRRSSDIKEPYLCKRKTSAPTPKCKVEQQEDKFSPKFFTHPQVKIIPESVFEKKFKTFIEKSLQVLSEIRNLLDKGIEPPDGDEDISRRKLRVKEFSNRFSRNYLYPIIRQIDDLSRFKQPHNSSNQKMLSAYHVIYNGLLAYQNHLPTSIGSCSFDKLKMLLKHSMDLCDIHYKLVPNGDENGYNDFIQSYKHNAEVTLQKAEDQLTNHPDIITSLQLNSVHFRTEHKTPKPNKKPKNNLEDRLYMYSSATVPKKDSLWKKAADAVGKKKLTIKSRYKTAQFKHRPPLQQVKTEVTVPIAQSNCKISTKKSISELKKDCISHPINDDNISTMIQMNDEANDRGNQEKDETNKELMNHEEIVVKLLQLVLEMKEKKKKDSCGGNDQRFNNGKVADILEKIKSSCDYEVLKKTLNELESDEKWENGNLELKIVESAESFPMKSSRIKKEPTVTVTGVKNAKLICIQDDNSIETDYDNSKDDQTEKSLKLNSDIRTDSSKENIKNGQKPYTMLSMKRSTKSTKYLQMLPKDYALNIIQYKIDFHKHCKSTPMYRKNTKMTPWILMDQLSDKILNLALLRVAKEVEISEVLEKMYQSELQFC